MNSIRATIEDRLTPRLRRVMPIIVDGVTTEVSRGARMLEGEVKRDISAHGPLSTGDLRKSIGSRVTTEGGAIVGTVASNVNYAEQAHEGQPAGHWVPIDELEKWVARGVRMGKLTLPELTGHVRKFTSKTGKQKLSKRDAKARFTRSMAYAIQHKIHEAGTSGRPFFDLVYLSAGPRVVRSTQRGVAAAIRRAITGETR